MRDLGAGLMRGLREIRWVVSTSSTAARRSTDGSGSTDATGATLLVISTGHANQGITGHDQWRGLVPTAFKGGVVTSTIGIGRGYDETLLSAISGSGAGNHAFADEPDAAGWPLRPKARGRSPRSYRRRA